MATVQITSNNPDFGFIIGKNPASGARFRSIRSGVATGFYSKENTAYNIFFQDSNSEISYKKEEGQPFEFLNTSKYISALFVTHAIQEFFNTAYKKRHEKDLDGFKNTFNIGLLYIRNYKHIESFQRHFPSFSIECVKQSPLHYSVSISTSRSISELLAFVNLFSYFFAIVNDEIIELADDAATKVIKLLNVVGAPYFIRYLFKVRFILFKPLFNQLKSTLEQYTPNKIDMTFSDSWSARREAVRSVLNLNNHVLDVGCGEGRYVFGIAPKLAEGKKYFAVDIDVELLNKVKQKAEKKGFKNVECSTSLQEFKDNLLPKIDQEGLGVIMSEVIEHMDINEAKELIRAVIQMPNIEQVVITTPDRRFNINYFEEGMRHDDHKWEADREEFISLIEEVKGDFSYSVLEIGDKVDGIPCTQGVILRKK